MRSPLRSALGVVRRSSRGKKDQFLDWLNWGVESGAIDFPPKSGPIHWPKLSLEGIFIDVA
jgi:hypothetical protein